MSGGFAPIGSIVLLLVLIIFLRSSFTPFDNDFYVFLIGGILLFVPIIAHIVFLVSKNTGSMDAVFYFTTLLFLIIYGLTLFGTFKKIKKS